MSDYRKKMLRGRFFIKKAKIDARKRKEVTERAFTLECGPYDRPTVQEGGAL